MTRRGRLIAAAALTLLVGACSSSKQPPATTLAGPSPSSGVAPTATTPAEGQTTVSAASTPTSGAEPTTTLTPTTVAPAQTESVTPSTGLRDGQVVTVVGKGFTQGSQVIVTECADKGTSTVADDCDLNGSKVASADSAGTVTAQYPVAKGPFGGNKIVCSASQKCLLSITNAGASDRPEVATEDISFAP